MPPRHGLRGLSATLFGAALTLNIHVGLRSLSADRRGQRGPAGTVHGLQSRAVGSSAVGLGPRHEGGLCRGGNGRYGGHGDQFQRGHGKYFSRVFGRKERECVCVYIFLRF